MAERFETRALTRREPFRELERFEEDMDRLLGRSLRWFDWPLYTLTRPLTMYRAYLPPLEIFERDGYTVIRLEVPGMRMEDIDISVSDGLLTIKGEKKMEEEIKEENYVCSERVYGSFHREVSIPEGIDTSKVSATYESGILEVSLPEIEEKEQHKIEVKAK